MAQARESLISEKQALLRRACEVTPGGVHSSLRNVDPRVLVTRTEGACIWDASGKRYIDYLGAFGPPILGHCHAGVAARIRQTLGGDVFFAGTFNGHPVGCAAALAIIEALELAHKASRATSTRSRPSSIWEAGRRLRPSGRNK